MGSDAPTMDKLRDLLAIIHRDGGHYTEEHGLQKSWEDAIIRVPNLVADNACLREQILAGSKDVALARKILYWIAKTSRRPDALGIIGRVAERCIKELKTR